MLQRTEELDGVLQLILASCCPPDTTPGSASETDIHVETLEDTTNASSALGQTREAGGKVGIASTLAPALQVCAVLLRRVPPVAC